MPKISQVVVSDGKGRGRRLMVRAKKGSKLAKHRRKVFKTDANGRMIYDPTAQTYLTEIVIGERVDGCLRGTREVPPANAVKHPITKAPQTTELLVQMGTELAGIPVSEVELYWQKGDIRPGNRFVPDKVTPPAVPQPDAPKP